MKKVLWIEDLATTDLSEVAAPVFTSMKYDLRIAENTTDALTKLQGEEFDAVIVDIRLPPGRDSRWANMYKGIRKDKSSGYLGLHLVMSLLKSDDAKVKLNKDEVPGWITPLHFGFLTVEPWEIHKEQLELLGIDRKIYIEKGRSIPRQVLLNLIEKVLARKES